MIVLLIVAGAVVLGFLVSRRRHPAGPGVQLVAPPVTRTRMHRTKMERL